jgi:hypothetical protein
VAWLRHLQRAVAPLHGLTAPQVAALTPGQALVWARDATDAVFTRSAVRVNLRPRVTQHGGNTILAVAVPAAVRATVPLLPPASRLLPDLAAPQLPQLMRSWRDAPETAVLASTTRGQYGTAARRWLRWAITEQQPLATPDDRAMALSAYAQTLRQRHTRHVASSMLTGARRFAAWLNIQHAALPAALPPFADTRAEPLDPHGNMLVIDDTENQYEPLHEHEAAVASGRPHRRSAFHAHRPCWTAMRITADPSTADTTRRIDRDGGLLEDVIAV